MTTPLLSWLYVPGDRPDRFDKARAAAPSAVVVDLEDAVDPSRKVDARRHAVDHLAVPAGDGPEMHVRINAPSTPWGVADLDALAQAPGLRAVRVPKVESAADVDVVASHIDESVDIYCLIESARGLRAIDQIATHPRVTGIALGEQDLAAELGMTHPAAVDHVRLTAVLAASAAGLPPVPVSVHPYVDDDDGFLATSRHGRTLGMFGRSAIHPRQVPLIARAFRPDPDEVAWATAVTEAAERASAVGVGAVSLPTGEFIDVPITERARRVLALEVLTRT